ncbi:4-[[4-(2-aminoethyl)phenoxy]-methyl]-2-furanmethanamine-glutamate synthase [uncultured archaeon]|nr:4-[[4-(2-aminoethyl)phenoxy]-methyl]-2-furanmethanamine-glutamate synthase [uncultured archaeon]
MILGLDIGGANTKAASSDGALAESVYLPLWRDAPLDEILQRLAEKDPESVGVVITGELADCYRSKAEGISSIKATVEKAFCCPVYFWGVNGFDWRDPMELAAANWSASSALVARDFGDCLFVDVGSTTTDIIPIRNSPLASATDYLRLVNGELVYTGMLRTSIGSLLQAARLDEHIVRLSPEVFAITADAYLVTGQISPEQYSCDTPDGFGKDRDSALCRLARTVCADLDEIGESLALSIARQTVDLQLEVITQAIEKQSAKHHLDNVVATGIGEKIIARASQSLGMNCICLSEKYGKHISDIFPAFAVAKLLDGRLQMGSP